jgi:hypothetical protein
MRILQSRRGALALSLLTVAVITGCTAEGGEVVATDPTVSASASPPDTAISAEPPEGAALETEIYRETLDASWSAIVSLDPSAIRPRTEIVRYVTIEEHFDLVAECVTAQGFPATASADGSVSFGVVPQAQASALNIAVYVCQASYPMEDKYMVPPNEDQLRRLYEHYVGDSIGCLTALGYTISRPPSLQQFLDTVDTKDSWSPFAEALATAGEAEYVRVNATCPQQPEDWWG